MWQRTPGVGLSPSDTPAKLAAFLDRNPGCSTAAFTAAGELVGTVLCGHDGRRGMLYHVAVAVEHRRRGLASAMLERSLARLAAAGIDKCNLCLYGDNLAGAEFWSACGANWRRDLQLWQFTLTPVVKAS